jgi:hypothetical protein
MGTMNVGQDIDELIDQIDFGLSLGRSSLIENFLLVSIQDNNGLFDRQWVDDLDWV